MFDSSPFRLRNDVTAIHLSCYYPFVSTTCLSPLTCHIPSLPVAARWVQLPTGTVHVDSVHQAVTIEHMFHAIVGDDAVMCAKSACKNVDFSFR